MIFLTNYVKVLFKDVFNVELYIKKHRTNNELFVWKQSKNLVYTLNFYGLPAGNKIKNNVKTPEWIFQKESFIKACLRGIIDTDGCVYPKTPEHKYPSIWTKSGIPALRKSISKALSVLSFHPSKWTSSGTPQCCLGKSKEIKRYNEEIGFRNQKHLDRWKKYAPVV